MLLLRSRVFQAFSPVALRKLKDSTASACLAITILFALVAPTTLASTPGKSWVDKTLKELSLRDKIGQLIQIRVTGRFLNRQSEEYQALQYEIRHNHIGGVVLFAGNIYESVILLNELQGMSRLPLLVASDFERGAAFRITDTTSFPWAMALGATGSEHLAYRQGEITAREARAMGVHWIFAPVMDVNNNPDNPVINIRAFGEAPELVARLGSAFIRGAKKGGVLTTAKHFPGHGDTATDSHLGLAVIPSDAARLQSLELIPFRSAVEAGVDSIMSGHIAVPQMTGDSRSPATLSTRILTELLRKEIGFKGLVVTDALEMGAIADRYWAGLSAVRAIQAGADVLVLPTNATVAIDEVERAVKRGDISEERIDQSVSRVLSAKRRLGLHQSRMVPLHRIGDIIAAPEHTRIAQDIADQSITLLRDTYRLLPLDPTAYPQIFSLVVTPDLESSPGTTFQNEMRRRFPGLKAAWANARVSEELLNSIEKTASQADVIVCASMTRLVTGQSPAVAPEGLRKIYERLLIAGKPIIWVALGNPYVIPPVPRIDTCLFTFGYSDVSQIAAAKALAGEIPISGRMPISVPGLAKVGEGLSRPRQEMILERPASQDLELWNKIISRTALLLDSIVEEKILRAATLLVGYKSKLILDHATSQLDDFGDPANKPPASVLTHKHLVDSVATAFAVMLTMDTGALILDAPVSDYLPESRITGIRNKTLRELLAARNISLTQEQFNVRVESLVSRTTGLPMERFLRDRLYSPLGIQVEPTARPPAAKSKKILAPYGDASNLAVLAQLLLNRGVYGHRRYLKPETVDRATMFASIWSRPSESDWTASVFSPQSFGKVADSGSLLWVEPRKKLFIVLLGDGNAGREKVAEAQKNICKSIIAAIGE